MRPRSSPAAAITAQTLRTRRGIAEWLVARMGPTTYRRWSVNRRRLLAPAALFGCMASSPISPRFQAPLGQSSLPWIISIASATAGPDRAQRFCLLLPCPLPRLVAKGRSKSVSHHKPLNLLARSEGFEPPTPRFEVWCSIQLSYERVSGIRQCSDLPRRNVVGRLG
jgi:hypothetical protein